MPASCIPSQTLAKDRSASQNCGYMFRTRRQWSDESCVGFSNVLLHDDALLMMLREFTLFSTVFQRCGLHWKINVLDHFCYLDQRDKSQDASTCVYKYFNNFFDSRTRKSEKSVPRRVTGYMLGSQRGRRYCLRKSLVWETHIWLKVPPTVCY